ncbi:MAG: hypothetical protein D3925_06365, partial [Candidatus Electrothrix sp. AR5]|nr:hypothetical protein [Candidatus Electrothrix sp. AR5]
MRKKNHTFLLFFLISSLTLAGCSPLHQRGQKAAPESGSKVKNVIMVIGDGMGPQQLGLLLAYAKQAPHSVIKNNPDT